MKIKTIVDELFAIGHFVDESDWVTCILDGLPEEYDPTVMNVAIANFERSRLYCLRSWTSFENGDVNCLS